MTRRRVRLCALVPLFALLVVLAPYGFPSRAEASAPSCADTSFPRQDLLRSGDIDFGPDLGGTGCSALNFTGATGSAGDTWMTADTDAGILSGQFILLSADVLIHRFNNKKGAGLFALFNEEPGKKGLALILYDNGNTDSLVLSTVDQVGRLSTLTAVFLGSAIRENVWYSLAMQVAVSGDNVSVIGTVSNHETPADPNSGLGSQVGMLTYVGPLPAGVDASGEVGVIASAVNAQVDSSVTNFLVAIP